MNFTKLQNKLEKIRDTAEKTAADVFVKHKVLETVQKERFSICQSCEHLYTKTNTCKICGCFMGVKTWMAHEHCPIHRWSAADTESK